MTREDCIIDNKLSITNSYRGRLFSTAVGLIMVHNIILSPQCGSLWPKQTRPRESTANFGSRTGRVVWGLIQPRTAQGGRETTMAG